MLKYIDEDEAYRQYDDMLDEIYPEVNVGVTLSPSHVLKECDPIAYRTGLLDWLDSENLTTERSEADEDEDEDE